MTPLAPPLRLAEAAGVLSLATDLAMGQPLEHGLRTAMLALRTAQAMGLPQDDQVTVYYTGLLHFAGCTAESERSESSCPWVTVPTRAWTPPPSGRTRWPPNRARSPK